MKLIHYDFDKLKYEILVTSFEEYKEAGGSRDYLDSYSRIKELAKTHESNYISFMDMSLSGIPVDENGMNNEALRAESLWHLLSLWFGKERRHVSYRNFHLEEFNKL